MGEKGEPSFDENMENVTKYVGHEDVLINPFLDVVLEGESGQDGEVYKVELSESIAAILDWDSDNLPRAVESGNPAAAYLLTTTFGLVRSAINDGDIMSDAPWLNILKDKLNVLGVSVGYVKPETREFIRVLREVSEE